MIAVYKRELKSYFTNILGFLFAAFLLFVVGLYFTAYNLLPAYPYFGYVVGQATFIFLILVPIITMRSMSEERKAKTDQLLLTSPVSLTGIIMGKYLALVTVLAVPLLVICLYPLILASMGKTSLPMAYCAILAFFLLGCVYLAIGMFISSLTESAVLAAVLTFAVLFADYLISGIASFFSTESIGSYLGIAVLLLAVAIVLYILTKNVVVTAIVGLILEGIAGALYMVKPTLYSGMIMQVFDALDITARINDFVNGIFNTSNIIYFVSVAALFIFLTVQSVEKRRWS